jgi:hypothetical protein
VGPTAAVTAPVPNSGDGIKVQTGASNVQVGGTVAGAGNLVSGNSRTGVSLLSGTSTVQGNYIGVDAAGSAAIPNVLGGIYVESSGNQIGGSTAGARNVISGNGISGIQGNYIGVTASGASALGNLNAGIQLQNVTGTVIGGSSAGLGNVISSNAGSGIQMQGGSGTSIQGNYIGLNAAGNAGLGNSFYGVFLTGGASSNTVGGGIAAARNIISANLSDGIQIEGGTGNVVAGNYIGTDASGTLDVGNLDDGIQIFGASTSNVISGNVRTASACGTPARRSMWSRAMSSV